MKILVLGGTRFFGIHMVNELLINGHEVTVATRGKVQEGLQINSPLLLIFVYFRIIIWYNYKSDTV